MSAMLVSTRNIHESLKAALIPDVVTCVDISGGDGAFIEFKVPACEIPALTNWCQVSLPVEIGYMINPLDK